MEILMFVVFLGICVFQGIEYNKLKHDLKLYMDKYKKSKTEYEELKVKLDTINHIYKATEKSILDNTRETIIELKQRLPKMSSFYQVTTLDKKYILDLVFILGYRLSLEKMLDLNLKKYSNIKINKVYTIKEASEGLLGIIQYSKLFSDNMYDSKPTPAQTKELYKDLKMFVDYTNRLLVD